MATLYALYSVGHYYLIYTLYNCGTSPLDLLLFYLFFRGFLGIVMFNVLLISDLQCLLSHGASWLLVFEPSKTQVLTASNCRDPLSNPPVVMNGTPVIRYSFWDIFLIPKDHCLLILIMSQKHVRTLRQICDY